MSKSLILNYIYLEIYISMKINYAIMIHNLMPVNNLHPAAMYFKAIYFLHLFKPNTSDELVSHLSTLIFSLVQSLQRHIADMHY